MLSKKHNQLLARVNFPLYAVHVLTERHILVTGGGGSSRTGIHNVIEIYELINNGSTCRAESVTHYETGSEAIMNCVIHNAGRYYLLFAGMEGNCQVYKIKHNISDEGINIDNKPIDNEKEKVKLRKKKKNGADATTSAPKSATPDDNANVIHSRLFFDITKIESFQTDFSDDPFQKLVRFSAASSLLATAGCDGHIRIWKHPQLNQVFDIEAHSDYVDDISICPLGKRIVSVSRDGFGKVWDAETGLLISELKYDLPSKSNAKYKFRNCRFGIVDDKDDFALYATLNPAERSKRPSQCYICKWETEQFLQKKIIAAGKDMFTAMAINDNGRFIGLGTESGSVRIYIAFSLQQIYNVHKVHGFFVTGLEFLPSRDESRRITGGNEASLVSISVDNRVNIHHVPMRPSMGILTLITLFILTLFFIFVLMDFMNL